jgi:mono/diheme cytochrome c family protein
VLLDGLRDMPPIGGMMSDAQVADIVNYVRTHFGNAYPDALSPADVAAARRRAPSDK